MQHARGCGFNKGPYLKYLPAQSVQVVASAGECLPAAQFAQAAPAAANLPAAQAAHASPSADLPAAQAAQSPLTLPAPAATDLPAAHLVQVSALASAYVPTGQSVQAVPVASVAPDLPAAQSLAPEAAPQRKARARSIFAAQAARRLMIIWGSNVCACVRVCKRVCGGHEK